MDRVEIKKRAKEFASKNKWNIWKPLLVYMGIVLGIQLILTVCGLAPEYETSTTNSLYNIVKLITQVALLPLSIGYVYYIINLIRGKQLELKDIFSKYKYTLPIIVITFLVGLFTTLWSLLFIIPGIIYGLKMSMVQYLLADELDNETGYMDLLNKSKKMMDGYKIDFLLFTLSFLGWILLTCITFGIAGIWTIPYIITAETMYYEELKKKNS